MERIGLASPVPTQNSKCQGNSMISLTFGVLSRDSLPCLALQLAKTPEGKGRSEDDATMPLQSDLATPGSVQSSQFTSPRASPFCPPIHDGHHLASKKKRSRRRAARLAGMG